MYIQTKDWRLTKMRYLDILKLLKAEDHRRLNSIIKHESGLAYISVVFEEITSCPSPSGILFALLLKIAEEHDSIDVDDEFETYVYKKLHSMICDTHA